MYKFSIEQVKDPVILTKLVKKFKAKERRRFNKAQRYYEVKNDIYARKMSDLKENNKIAHGFARYITNMATAYFIGKSVRYSWMMKLIRKHLMMFSTRTTLTCLTLK